MLDGSADVGLSLYRDCGTGRVRAVEPGRQLAVATTSLMVSSTSFS